jgi:hypothetical protein
VILRSQVVVESNVVAATAYVTGPLTIPVAARAIMACRALPPGVRRVRVDVRAVTVCDSRALAMLDSYIADWRMERRGSAAVMGRKGGVRDAFVAIPCTIRDAPDAELRPERDDRVVSTPPYSVW